MMCVQLRGCFGENTQTPWTYWINPVGVSIEHPRGMAILTAGQAYVTLGSNSPERMEQTMDSASGNLTRFALLCGQCSCGCPELFVDHDAAPERQIVITDGFGQRAPMRGEPVPALSEEARSGRLDQAMAAAVRA